MKIYKCDSCGKQIKRDGIRAKFTVNGVGYHTTLNVELAHPTSPAFPNSYFDLCNDCVKNSILPDDSTT